MERQKLNELLREVEVELSKAQYELMRLTEEEASEEEEGFVSEIYALTDKINSLTKEFEGLLQQL